MTNSAYIDCDIKVYLPHNKIVKINADLDGTLVLDGITDRLKVRLDANTKASIKNIKKLDIDLYGSTKACLEGIGELYVDCSGASNLIDDNIKTKVGIDLSGAYKCKIDNCDTLGSLEADVSGASNLQVTAVEIDELEIDASGASRVLIRSKVNSKDIDSSGAARVDLV